MRTKITFILAAMAVCFAGTRAAFSLGPIGNSNARETVISAEGSPEGHWEGTLKADNREIGISLDLAKSDPSGWIGSMGVPAEKMTGLVVTEISVNGNIVNFVAVELQMAKVNLMLTPDGSMKGTITSPQGPVPIEFKRMGDAKVQLIAPSPAVSKELEGDWEGSLQTPGRAFRVTIHFKNQPDKTVAATMEVLESGPGSVPLNDIRQTGQKVEFGIKVAHSSFQGALNPEGNQLEGKWMHEETAMQLSLRKK
ncbi:MAG TPA: hypothetical protein VMG30_15935 [Acidobacteriota bacterium]|nr:hypothetical protein [Acidobacteriota bacterium]